MTKSEFLSKLQSALENDLDITSVRENVDYYRSYIDGEVAKGRREAEVLEELGDPWVIAQSVIDMEEDHLTAKEGYRDTSQQESSYRYGQKKTSEQDVRDSFRVHTYSFDSWWKTLLLILGIVGVFVLVVTVVGGIISFFFPLIMFVAILGFIINLIKRFR